MSRVLIVEDEQHIADGLRFNLEAEGMDATVVGNGSDAVDLLLRSASSDASSDGSPNGSPNGDFDAVILDVMLPGKDGFTVATELRASGQYVPILMLTARGRAEDVLRGFEAGADDYLPKPFELSILLARLRGLMRRGAWQRTPPAADAASSPAEVPTPDVFEFVGRRLDFGAMELTAKNRTHRLTRMECELLRYLVKSDGKAVSRAAILEDVWGVREDTDTRPIDNFIVRLRRYIEDNPSSPRFLVTVRGVGYKFLARGTGVIGDN